MLLFISLCLLIRQIQLGQESDSVCDIFFFAHLMYVLMLLYQLFTKITLQDKDFYMCLYFQMLSESFMALWAVYHLLYPENDLELIPNIVCMFALGVY